jgi:hypothetical protein
MAAYWWTAVCDTHKERIDVFVNNHEYTYKMLRDDTEISAKFFRNHHCCELRMVHLDPDLDQLNEDNYWDLSRLEPGIKQLYIEDNHSYKVDPKRVEFFHQQSEKSYTSNPRTEPQAKLALLARVKEEQSGTS